MKISILGGGPAGLYSAILVKLQEPSADVSVFERNDRNSTFGFGIVLSAETLKKLDAADPVSGAAIRQSFAYWDDLYVQFKGESIKSSGHGYSGLERLTLLKILAARADELGVQIHWNHDVSDFEKLLDADLVVASDGINSVLRNHHKDHFKPSVTLQKNHFVWLGTDKPLPGFTFMFRENEHGIWIVHAYEYKPGHSTFVVETTPETFERSGLAVTDEVATADYIKSVFHEELEGHNILTNRSHWRQFPVVHCEKWHHQNVVLIGDAAHTAHFSIGSGTKLALEDAMSLAQNITGKSPDIPQALKTYEEERRPRAKRIQAAAKVSLDWFENIERHLMLPPLEFSFSLLTRSKEISFDNLRRRDAKFVARVTSSLSGSENDEREPIDTPITVGPIALRQRVVALPKQSIDSARPYFAIAATDQGISVSGEDYSVPPIGRLFGFQVKAGEDNEETIARASRAKDQGACLIHLTTEENKGDPFVLAEHVRSTTLLPVLLSGAQFTRDEMNTALAAGRVDIFGSTTL